MSRSFRAITESGHSLFYHVAEGPRGKEALRDMERQCKGGRIVEIPKNDMQIDAKAVDVSEVHGPKK